MAVFSPPRCLTRRGNLPWVFTFTDVGGCRPLLLWETKAVPLQETHCQGPLGLRKVARGER